MTTTQTPLYYRFRGWLHKKARERTIDWIRRQNADKREGEVELESIDVLPDDDIPIVLTDLLSQLLWEELLRIMEEHLSPRDWRILKLHYVERYTHREIGELLRLTTDNVSQIIKRSIDKLREKLWELEYLDYCPEKLKKLLRKRGDDV
jgi:RNA polymerase sigma factor (sigma-70 family)